MIQENYITFSFKGKIAQQSIICVYCKLKVNVKSSKVQKMSKRLNILAKKCIKDVYINILANLMISDDFRINRIWSIRLNLSNISCEFWRWSLNKIQHILTAWDWSLIFACLHERIWIFIENDVVTYRICCPCFRRTRLQIYKKLRN